MADAAAPAGSLADRITQPLSAASATFSPAAAAAPTQDSPSWADEVASPTGAAGDEISLPNAQGDGSSEPLGGSTLHDAQYEVEVKLSDLQGDVNSPLHSISTFDELGMYVSHICSLDCN
jgi:ATP-dependent RNA helicase DDX19/DBP5